MSSEIPRPYSILFTLLDPLVALWGTYLFLFSPQTVTSSYLPPSHASLPIVDPSKSHPASAPFSPFSTDPATVTAVQQYSLPLHAQIAGHLLSNALLSALLLRASPSLKIWRIYQFSLLLVDVSLLYGTFASYALQGRSDPMTTWRVEDWGAVGITALAGLARASFLLGLGFPTQHRVKRA